MIEEKTSGRSVILEKYPILSDSMFFEKCLDEFSKKIVGERETCHVLFLVAQGRLVENAEATSGNIVLNSESGAGKDHVVKNVLDLIPKKDLKENEITIKRTRISETVLTYWHNAKYEPEWTWNGKVFYNEDVSEKIFNCDVLKTMASGGTSSTITIKQRAIDIEINGKPIMVFTFAKNSPNPELLRRFPFIELDETANQTKGIMRLQARKAMCGVLPGYNQEIIEAQNFLEKVSVVIPFAELITDSISQDNLILRTQFQRFLDYIKFSAGFHQFQRETDENGFIVANGQDYDIARMAVLKSTVNSRMIPLTKDQKRLLRIISGLWDGLNSSEKEIGLDIETIISHITFLGETRTREQLDALAEHGFLIKGNRPSDHGIRPILIYRYVGFVGVSIPTWTELCRKSENSERPKIDNSSKNSENSNAINEVNNDNPLFSLFSPQSSKTDLLFGRCSNFELCRKEGQVIKKLIENFGSPPTALCESCSLADSPPREAVAPPIPLPQPHGGSLE